MTLTGYEKLKRCRDRKRRAAWCCRSSSMLGAVGDRLVETGFFGSMGRQDRDKLRAALEQLLEVWTAA